MWRSRVRTVVLTGVVVVFAIWVAPVRSQEQTEKAKVEEVKSASTGDPKAAVTTKELDIPTDELNVLVKPLTLEELQNEVAGWMALLKNKAKEISRAEVAIKRQNLAINKQDEGANALKQAQDDLEAAKTAQATAKPGSPEYEESTKKVEEAQKTSKKLRKLSKRHKQPSESLKKTRRYAVPWKKQRKLVI